MSLTRRAALDHAAALLAQAGLDDARREARLLLQYVLGCDALAVLHDGTTQLSAQDEARFHAALTRRAAHEPLARIRGTREFWGLSFALSGATLDPRPDSETLLECVRTLFPDHTAPLNALDLGTGSGCLLLAFLHDYPHARGTGTDINPEAVAMARQNAQMLALDARALFITTRWADGVDGLFDLILSNPPYIESALIDMLARAVKDYDPILALDGGADGLVAYRALISEAFARLKNGGWLCCEIGQGQEEAVTALFSAAGFQNIAARADLAGIPRVIFGQR